MAFTQVSGQVYDPNGFPYAGANLSARLVSTATPFVGSALIDAYATVKLDANGNFSLQLADNATVTPVASTWTFTVETDNSNVPPPLGTGAQAFTVAGITITGAAQDIGANLRAVAPNLTRAISSGGGGGNIPGGGVIGPSSGHASVIDPALGNVVLEVISDSLAVVPLAIGCSALPLATVAIVLAGQGNSAFFYLTSDGINLSFIEFGTVGGVSRLRFNTSSLGFFLNSGAAQQTPVGGFGGNPALRAIADALGGTAGYGLFIDTSLIAGQDIPADGAINPVAGNVVLRKGTPAAITLAAPTTPAQDYTILRVVSTTAQAHVITGPAAGFNAGGAGADVATFTTAAIGDSLTLMAFNGVWYIVGSTGVVTLS